MKKFLLLTTLLCGWMGSAMAAGENTITVKDATAAAGNVTVELEMINPTLEAVAFQCDVKAPEGVAFSMDDVVVAVADRKVDHIEAHNVLDDGKTLRIVCYSMTNASFSGTEGTVATFTMPLTKTTIFTVDNIVIADKASLSDKSNGQTGEITIGEASSGDLNGDTKVNASDLSLLIKYVSTLDLRGDINGDGKVNAADISLMLKLITSI